MDADRGSLHPAEAGAETLIALPLDWPPKGLDERIGRKLYAFSEGDFLCQVNEMEPDKLVILAQLFSAVHDLPVADDGYFNVFEEDALLISVSAIKEG